MNVELPDDIVETYFKRVARQCVRDHANRSSIDVMQESIEDWKRWGTYEDWSGEDNIAYYRQLRRDRLEDVVWRVQCLPWTEVKLEDVRLVFDTKSNCWASIEVTYGTRGERAIYGITKFDGKPVLWAD